MQTPRYDGVFVFGDVAHATTRLCAAAVDLYCRERELDAMLDVGTGTGVLARIARARGTRFVAATDIDASALQLARDLSAVDGCPQAIRYGSEAPDHWGARFDLVVANILAEPLILLAPHLARALAGDGVLLISGFTPLQSPALRVRFEQQGLACAREATLENWSIMELRRLASRVIRP